MPAQAWLEPFALPRSGGRIAGRQQQQHSCCCFAVAMSFIFNYRPEDGARWRQLRLEAQEAAAATSSAAPSAPSEIRAPRASPGGEGQKRRRRRDRSLESLERPLSPNTHLQKMQSIAGAHLDLKPCKEHHREYYYSRDRLGLTKPIGHLEGIERPPTPVERFGMPPTKPKRWGPNVSDSGKAGDYVDRMWLLRKLQRHNSQPIMSTTADLGRQEPRINPSADSPGISSCLVGGTTIAARQTSRVPAEKRRDDVRQVGLYEDSFCLWDTYEKPKHGLSSTDVTAFADASVQQKNLMRK